ncbi:hypothetical protein [Brevundimonas pondensis]|uniref:YARHG domain-containing protein n=1 Tax=Brevundimonas pondensis TaxID=2774189 RepID=A0ABX7SP15_9CAUL|nr:hypothetical protein [Brevundimonas pondensis]QTC88532.1 hypothetical protein IFE19_03855 [Brevundimonas pondensis]
MMKSKRNVARLSALALLIGAGFAGASTTGATKAEAKTESDYVRCYFQGYDACLPRTSDGFVYLPSPGSAAEAAFEQCLADVEAACSAQYPEG